MWSNKKYRKTKLWKGGYMKTKKGERLFILTLQGKLPKDISNIERVYESWQEAKKAGWVKI